MTDGSAGRPAGRGHRPRPTVAQRRERRAAVDDPALVLAAAARYLEVRSRSIAETRRHLVEAGYRPNLVSGAVDRLLDLGLLDDEAFARAWVSSRDRARPRGERALRRELVLKGIADETIRSVLAARHDGTEERLDALGVALPAWEDETRRNDDADAVGAGADELAPADERAAVRLLEKRAAALGRVDDPRVRRRRAYALLARNGFDPDVAARVAERFVREGPG